MTVVKYQPLNLHLDVRIKLFEWMLFSCFVIKSEVDIAYQPK